MVPNLNDYYSFNRSLERLQQQWFGKLIFTVNGMASLNIYDMVTGENYAIVPLQVRV